MSAGISNLNRKRKHVHEFRLHKDYPDCIFPNLIYMLAIWYKYKYLIIHSEEWLNWSFVVSHFRWANATASSYFFNQMIQCRDLNLYLLKTTTNLESSSTCENNFILTNKFYKLGITSINFIDLYLWNIFDSQTQALQIWILYMCHMICNNEWLTTSLITWY